MMECETATIEFGNFATISIMIIMPIQITIRNGKLKF